MKIFIFFFLILFIFNTRSFVEESKIYVVFRNDDISALSDVEHEKKIMNIFERYRIPQTLGVIPNIVEYVNDSDNNKYHPLSENHNMVELLKKWHRQGLIEIVQHGYTHKPNKFYLSQEKGFSEFRGLTYKEQLDNIVKGKEILEETLSIPIASFIPPFNSHDGNTIKALKDSGFRLVGSNLNPDDYKINNPIIIQYTTELNEFKSFFKETEKFIEKHNVPVMINVLYHSKMFKEDDTLVLEEALNMVSSSNKVEFLTLEQLAGKFQTQLSGLTQIKKSTESITEKTNRLLSYFKIKPLFNIEDRFVVLSKDYYFKEKFWAYLILGLFIFVY